LTAFLREVNYGKGKQVGVISDHHSTFSIVEDSVMRRIRVLLPLAVVVGLVGGLMIFGCGVRQLTRGELIPPEVRLKSLMLQPPTNQGWPLDCVLAVENPNSMTIRVLGYDYEVWVAGQSVAKGVGNKPVTLPARGETTVTVPVVLRLRNLPGLLPNLLQEKKIPVEIAGGLRLPQTLGFRVPFRFREELTPQEGLEQIQPFLGR
jgi:LEA14-like dessication related protein